VRATALWCATIVLGNLSEEIDEESGKKRVSIQDGEILNQFLIFSAQSIQQADAVRPSLF